MCGIVGIVSNKSVSASIIGALKKLEYRGYDSAGISTLSNNRINEDPEKIVVEMAWLVWADQWIHRCFNWASLLIFLLVSG